MHDPLDALLGPPAAAPREAWREKVFTRTTRALRRRRTVARFRSVGVLLAAYAAGLLTFLGLTPPDGMPGGNATGPSGIVSPNPPPRASDLEWQALDRPEQARAIYHRVADQYLDEGDPANAVRCYGNALNEGGREALEIRADDSWLLMAIKQARKKEMDE